MSKKIFAVLMVTGIIAIAVAQPGFAQDSVTYENPLAYVGSDHNVYITDGSGGVGTAITVDASESDQYVLDYRVSSWSPDGRVFIYVKNYYEEILYILKSGRTAEAVPELLYAEPHTAWSPDGTQFAYFGRDGEFGIFSLPVDGGEPLLHGTGLAFSFGEGPGLGLPEAHLAREQGRNEFTESRYLAWLPQGVFYGMYVYESCIGAVIVQADDALLCSDQLLMPPFAISPDGSRIIGRTMDHVSPIELTFSLGESNPAVVPPDTGLPAGAIPLAWSEDGLYYALNTDTVRVESEWHIEFGYFEYTERTLTLWLSKLDGSPDTKIYQTRGYGIGRVALPPSDDLPLVVSIVTSDVPAAEAFNSGASADDIEALRSHVEMVALHPTTENTAPLWTLLGGQPLYGKGSFTVLTSAE